MLLNTVAAKPFIKWAGGKTRMIPKYQPWLPHRYDAYHEPFLGGGAMFFHLQPKRSILSDVNSRLINCYLAVRDFPNDLIKLLEVHATLNSEAYFYEMRSECPAVVTEFDIIDAARFIYLNKTCFNGLYRVNGSGLFNASWGKYRNPVICDKPNLLACSRTLAKSEIHCRPWAESMAAIEPKSFVFLDPPYVAIDSQASNFNSYDKPFTMIDQTQLAIAAAHISQSSRVLIANSDTPTSRGLYPDFSLESFSIHRAIGAGTVREKRKVGELLAIGGAAA